jgi:hypothetical protein
MPESVDWFIFPSGIAPIVQPTAAQVRLTGALSQSNGPFSSS